MAKSESTPIQHFVTNQHDILPVLVRVTQSTDKQVSVGDVLNVKKATERYEIQYNNPLNKHKIRAFVPHNLGGFLAVSQFPANHVYSSIHEVALDLPSSVRILEDVNIQGNLIKRGEELSIQRIHKIGAQQYVVCTRLPSETHLLVPFHVTGRFQRVKDNSVYAVKELQHRMPLSVKRDPNMGDDIRRLHEQYLPGIPIEVAVFLKKSTTIQVDHWHQPTILDVGRMKDMLLSDDKNIEVTQISYSEYFAPVQNLTAVPRGSIGMVYVDNDDIEYDSRMPEQGAMVVVEGSETKQGVILRGTSSFILVSRDYRKGTLFRMRKQEYTTPHDLWKANHTDVVTATQTSTSPSGYQTCTSSIYQGDKVQLVKRSKNKKLSVVSNVHSDDQLEVVKLLRLFTHVEGRLGNIKVDSKAKACFEEPSPVVGHHKLSEILRHGKKIPMDISLASVSEIDNLSKCDSTLVCESPFTVTNECKYTVTNVTCLQTNTKGQISRQQTFQVPNFIKFQLRVSRDTPPIEYECVEKPPEAFVYRLSPKVYKSLVGKLMEESYRIAYDEFNDSVFPSQPDIVDRLSRLFPVSTKQVSPPSSPQLSQSNEFSSQSLPNRRPPGKLVDLEERRTSHPKLEPPAIPTGARTTKEKRPPKPPIRTTSVEDRSPAKPRPKPRNKSDSLLQINTRYKSDDIGSVTPGQDRDYLTPFVISDKTVPKVPPPTDNNIASFSYIQLAGMMRYLDLCDHAIVNCVHNHVDGPRLLRIFRHKISDNEICQELKLEKLTEVYCLKQLVNQAELAAAIPPVKPPEDGNISNFNVQQLAGLFRHLDISEHAVSICLAQQIDGTKLCKMNMETWCKTLGIEKNKPEYFTMHYFILQSQQ